MNCAAKLRMQWRGYNTWKITNSLLGRLKVSPKLCVLLLNTLLVYAKCFLLRFCIHVVTYLLKSVKWAGSSTSKSTQARAACILSLIRLRIRQSKFRLVGVSRSFATRASIDISAMESSINKTAASSSTASAYHETHFSQSCFSLNCVL